MRRIPDYRVALAAELRAKRRAICEQSVELFARTYLGHHFQLAPSQMHIDLFALLGEITLQQRPRRVAVAAPRGHAKTTVTSLAFVLWCILYRKEMFVLLVSATREQASALLKTIKHELESNGLLLEDFPEACVPIERKHLTKPWKESQIALPNGVAVRALGAEQRMRGIKHNQHRPSLIVVDDLEDKEQTASAEQRRQLREWFEGTLLKMSEPTTNVVVVGTILHFDSLLANLTGAHTSIGQAKVSGWESSVYRAVVSHSSRPELWERWEAVYCGREEHDGASGPSAAQAYYHANEEAMLTGCEVLWEIRESYEALMIMRVREGRASFQAEKQNEPLDPAQCLFKEELFSFWDDQYPDASALLRAMGSDARVYGACDPSLGRRGGSGDYSAIVSLVEHPETGDLFVLSADIAHRTPDKTIARIIDYDRMYRYRDFALEANGFQELMVVQLRERSRAAGRSIYLKEVRHSTDKKGRIENLEPFISQGKIRFSKRHVMLLEQLRQFPLGAHDDGPDALEMAVGLVKKRRGEVGWVRIPWL